MKVSDFLGRRVLDKKANEIGKVSDLDIDPKKGVVNGLTISTSDFGLTRKDLEIKTADIDEVGDYLLLKIEKSEAEVKTESEQNNDKRRRLEIKK